MSLQQVLRKYQSSKRHHQKTKQMIRVDLQKKMQDLTISSLKLQNHKVNQIHKNQQAIETKLRKQTELMVQFRQNQQIWKRIYQELNQSLKQAGNLAHYAGYIEAEIGELIGEGTVAQYLQKAEAEQETEEQADEIQHEKIEHGLVKSQEQNAVIYKDIVESDQKYDSVI